MTTHDKTLKDNDRRNLSIHDRHVLREALPEYFFESYPKLVKLLEYYYDFMDSDGAPSNLIHDLFVTRDIVQTDESLLSYIEDELLLGQSYFEGFQNKRSAAQYSNTLYRSKGTLYSIQQFFRTFFGISPDVVYTKENVFFVGEDRIGPESQRYLTDDKLYQTYALLIKSGLPIADWIQEYKLFVHPAGMYIGGEVQAVGIGDLDLNLMPTAIAEEPVLAVSSAAIFGEESIDLSTTNSSALSIQASEIQYAFTEISGITKIDGAGDSDYRIALPQRDLSDYEVQQIARQYDTLGEALGTNSPTFDEDSDVGDAAAPRISSDLDTMDETNFVYYDSDG